MARASPNAKAFQNRYRKPTLRKCIEIACSLVILRNTAHTANWSDEKRQRNSVNRSKEAHPEWSRYETHYNARWNRQPSIWSLRQLQGEVTSMQRVRAKHYNGIITGVGGKSVTYTVRKTPYWPICIDMLTT